VTTCEVALLNASSSRPHPGGEVPSPAGLVLTPRAVAESRQVMRVKHHGE